MTWCVRWKGANNSKSCTCCSPCSRCRTCHSFKVVWPGAGGLRVGRSGNCGGGVGGHWPVWGRRGGQHQTSASSDSPRPDTNLPAPRRGESVALLILVLDPRELDAAHCSFNRTDRDARASLQHWTQKVQGGFIRVIRSSHCFGKPNLHSRLSPVHHLPAGEQS